jgi:hypothetical protein
MTVQHSFVAVLELLQPGRRCLNFIDLPTGRTRTTYRDEAA